MDLLVVDSANQAAGDFILTVVERGVIAQFSPDKSMQIASWTKQSDQARFEVQSDGRSVRIGFKRFIIDATVSDATVSDWFKTYNESGAPSVSGGLENKETISTDISNYTKQEKDRRLAEQTRLDELRATGLLSESELRLIVNQNVSNAQPNQPQYSPQPTFYRTRDYEGPNPTNPFAVISFILSLFGGSILAVIFGHVAMSQIRKTKESGTGLAQAGLIIGYITIGIIVIFVIVAMNSVNEVQY